MPPHVMRPIVIIVAGALIASALLFEARAHGTVSALKLAGRILGYGLYLVWIAAWTLIAAVGVISATYESSNILNWPILLTMAITIVAIVAPWLVARVIRPRPADE